MFQYDDTETVIELDDLENSNECVEPVEKRARIDIQTNDAPIDETSIPRILDGKYFEIISRDKTNVVAKCTKCKKQRKGCTKSTGNFMQHYKLEHGDLVAEVNLYKKQKIDLNQTTSLRQTTLPRLMVMPIQIVRVFFACFMVLLNAVSIIP